MQGNIGEDEAPAGDSCSLMEMMTEGGLVLLPTGRVTRLVGPFPCLPPEPPGAIGGKRPLRPLQCPSWAVWAPCPPSQVEMQAQGRRSGVRGRLGSLRKNIYLPDSSQVSPTLQGRSRVLDETSWVLRPRGWPPRPLGSPDCGLTGVRSPSGL